jgi:hypothetical protein
MSIKEARIKLKPGCGAATDYKVPIKERCNHNKICKNRPRYIVLRVYSMWNEIDGEKQVCADHYLLYAKDEKAKKCDKTHTYHWHTWRIPQEVKMLWQG